MTRQLSGGSAGGARWRAWGLGAAGEAGPPLRLFPGAQKARRKGMRGKECEPYIISLCNMYYLMLPQTGRAV